MNVFDTTNHHPTPQTRLEMNFSNNPTPNTRALLGLTTYLVPKLPHIHTYCCISHTCMQVQLPIQQLQREVLPPNPRQPTHALQLPAPTQTSKAGDEGEGACSPSALGPRAADPPSHRATSNTSPIPKKHVPSRPCSPLLCSSWLDR
jgi:hypothetical protein